MIKSGKFMLVLGCASLMIAISMGTRHGMGLFLEPVTSALGVDRETFSLTVAWQNLIHALPVFGILADLIGFRRIALIGGVVYGTGLWLASQSETALGLYTNLGGVVGIGIGRNDSSNGCSGAGGTPGTQEYSFRICYSSLLNWNVYNGPSATVFD